MSDNDRKGVVLALLVVYVFGLGACATIQKRRDAAPQPAPMQGQAAPADPILLVASCP
jgi:hypothetical protein